MRDACAEALTPMSLPSMWIAVIVPPVSVATPTIFAAAELTRNASSAKMDVFSEGYGHNGLEKVAPARFSEITAALDYLRAVAVSVDDTFGKLCVCAVRPRIRSMRGRRCQAVPAARVRRMDARAAPAGRFGARLSDVGRGKTRIPRRDETHAHGASGVVCWGVAKLVKAPDFDSGIRGFESFLPSHFIQWVSSIE